MACRTQRFSQILYEFADYLPNTENSVIGQVELTELQGGASRGEVGVYGFLISLLRNFYGAFGRIEQVPVSQSQIG